jgi:Kef-type K+ transport system membrane component KefB
VAIGGFVMPFILGFLAGYYVFDLSLLISLFLGGTLTATSIGITVRVLSDLKRQNSPESQIILGAAVIDDVLGVVLLALLYEYSIAGGVSLLNTSKILFFIIVFFLVAPIMAKTISHLIKHFELNSEIPGMIPVAMVSLVMFFAWIAHTLGAPELMGGFAAGLALSRRFFLPFGAALSHDPGFSHRIESQMQPIIQITTPIFFVMIGVSLDLASIDWSVTFIWLFFLLFLVIAIVSKFSGALVLNIPMIDRIAIGLAMIPRGEVGLIFAGLGLSAGIFDNDLYAGMIIVIAITTILSPLALKWHYRRYGEKIGNELIGRIDKPY